MAFLVVPALLLGLAAAPALAENSWGGYHWARTANPFPLQLGDNMSSAWDVHLGASMADWNSGPSTVLALNTVSGSGGKNCKASAGRVEVCNGRYGFNGWLGLAQIWISGTHIVQGVAKMNDSYLASGSYDETARRHVLCQEVGHTFGLDHQDESGADLNTCMDYSDSLGNPSPGDHDFDVLRTVYSHTDASNSYTTDSPVAGGKGGGKPNRLGRVRDNLWVEDLGDGNRRYVFVLWTQPGLPHGAPAGV